MGYTQHNKEEHAKAKKLMKKVAKAEDGDKKDLFRDLYVMMTAHQGAEEAVVFPFLKERVKDKNKKLQSILEMIEEHKLSNFQMGTLESTVASNETWDAKFQVLSEILTHHMDEEESDLASLAKKNLSAAEDEDLLEDFERVYAEKEKEKKSSLA